MSIEITVTSDNHLPTKSSFGRRESPVWQPYFTVSEEMDRALKILNDNYQLEDSGAQAGTVFRQATELGIYDLLRYLREFCQFVEWRLQGFPEYREKVQPKLEKHIEKFWKNVETLNQRHGVETVGPNKWLNTERMMQGLQQHMRDLGIHDGYYVAMTSAQMTAPTLEALKENDPRKYREFDKMRSELWVDIYERYRSAVQSAKRVLKEEPGAIAAKATCIKAMLNFWSMYKDYQWEIRLHAKDFAQYIFPMPPGVYPAFFDFVDVCLPDDQVEMTIETTPVPEAPGERWYDAVFDFKVDGIKIKCILDPYRWLRDIQVEGKGGEELRLKLGAELREFATGEDNYSYDSTYNGSPLRDELSRLEHFGLGVNFLIPASFGMEHIDYDSMMAQPNFQYRSINNQFERVCEQAEQVGGQYAQAGGMYAQNGGRATTAGRRFTRR